MKWYDKDSRNHIFTEYSSVFNFFKTKFDFLENASDQSSNSLKLQIRVQLWSLWKMMEVLMNINTSIARLEQYNLSYESENPWNKVARIIKLITWEVFNYLQCASRLFSKLKLCSYDHLLPQLNNIPRKKLEIKLWNRSLNNEDKVHVEINNTIQVMSLKIFEVIWQWFLSNTSQVMSLIILEMICQELSLS